MVDESGGGTSFGLELRRLREAAGLTQEELAERAGLTARAISSLERGERQRPYPHTIRALADALQLQAGERARLAAMTRQRNESPSAPSRTVPPTRALQLPLTPLLGREQELQALEDLLRQGTRIVTLTGPGGVGKTRLAVEVVSRNLDDVFPDGVAFVALAPLRDPALVLPTIADVLGLLHVGEQPAREALRVYLRDRRLLLLLDNVEHVAEAAPEVAALVESCPKLVVLATSRAPLRVRGEWEYSVGPLTTPTLSLAPEVADVLDSPAVALFVERARAVAPDFQLTRANAAAVAAICRRLDGLPLALELAAARVRLLDPAAMLARLDRALSLLTSGARDLPERQRTMEATIRWSYNLLGETERELFQRLSVFIGGWELAAAEAVGQPAEDILDLLSGLVERSLVEVERGEWVRYRMLEPVRQYARRLLEASGRPEQVERLHAAYYLTLAEEAEPELRRARVAEWLDRLDAERDNVRAAVAWALVHEQAELAVRLIYALRRFFWARGQHAEVIRWMEQVLADAEALAPGVRARASFVLHLIRYRLGAREGLVAAFEDAGAVLHAEGDVLGTAETLMNAGLAALGTDDIARAATLLEESHRLFASRADAHGQALTLAFRGVIPLRQGDFERAEEYLDQALALARLAGDPLSMMPALYYLALATQGGGQYEQASRYYGEFLSLSEHVKDRPNMAYALVGLAECWGARGEPERAVRLFGAADAIFESVGMSFHPFNMPATFHERYRKLVRAQISEQDWSAAWAEGRGMQNEQAHAYALAKPDGAAR